LANRGLHALKAAPSGDRRGGPPKSFFDPRGPTDRPSSWACGRTIAGVRQSSFRQTCSWTVARVAAAEGLVTSPAVARTTRRIGHHRASRYDRSGNTRPGGHAQVRVLRPGRRAKPSHRCCRARRASAVAKPRAPATGRSAASARAERLRLASRRIPAPAGTFFRHGSPSTANLARIDASSSAAVPNFIARATFRCSARTAPLRHPRPCEWKRYAKLLMDQR
jgi:hypothetical protein